MRLGHAQPSRAEYYDRTPSGKTNTFSAAAIGPHASTQRFAYTVPTGRKAFLQSIFAQVSRILAAAPAGATNAFVLVTPSGGAAATIIQALNYLNTAGSGDKGAFGASGELGAGDIIAASTVDLSTGGTNDFYLNAWYVEFDA